MKPMLAVLLTTGMTTAIAAGEPAEGEAPPPTELDPIIVTGKDDPLRNAGRRLREKLEESLPCMGCESSDPAKPGLPEALVRAFARPGPQPLPDDVADRADIASTYRHDRRFNDKAP